MIPGPALAKARGWLVWFPLVVSSGALADSWQVVGPGLAGTDYKVVAALASPSTTAYVASKRPVHATHYKASIVIDPRNIAMPENGTAVRFLNLVDDGEGGADPHSGIISVGFLRLQASDHQWHATFTNLQDSGVYTSAVNLPLGTGFPTRIEIEFWTGGVGTTTFCARRPTVPGSDVCTSALDMENADVDELRIGLFANGNPGGWTGSYAFDELKSSW
jgi:hypothetical protein